MFELEPPIVSSPLRASLSLTLSTVAARRQSARWRRGSRFYRPILDSFAFTRNPASGGRGRSVPHGLVAPYVAITPHAGQHDEQLPSAYAGDKIANARE